METSEKYFKKYFILLIIYTILSVGLISSIFLLPINEDYKMSIAIVLIILYMVGLMKFKPRLAYHLEELQFHKLKKTQGPKIFSLLSPDSEDFMNNLINHDYKEFFESKDFTLLSKYVKNKKQIVLKRPMLMVVAIIHNRNIDFHSKQIVQEINRHEDALYKKKQKIFNYMVFIIKSGKTLDPKVQDSCDFITLSKKGNRSIVTINAFYETDHKTYYFLYSNEYSPNVYYSYAVDQLNTYIK